MTEETLTAEARSMLLKTTNQVGEENQRIHIWPQATLGAIIHPTITMPA
jgi:hypothetical protein